ncbi:MAG: hypothetical protein U9M89_02090 [Patescibacteria group bacterium]|nr:hypothetical protein [Patescibacteria group bacterium]
MKDLIVNGISFQAVMDNENTSKLDNFIVQQFDVSTCGCLFQKAIYNVGEECSIGVMNHSDAKMVIQITPLEDGGDRLVSLSGRHLKQYQGMVAALLSILTNISGIKIVTIYGPPTKAETFHIEDTLENILRKLGYKESAAVTP